MDPLPSSAPPTVVVHASAIGSLDRTLALCHVRAQLISEPVRFAQLRRTDDCWIVVMNVEGTDARVAAATVGELARRGFAIVCIRPGAATVREQCMLLLAGAAQVMDAADPGFTERLCDWIQRALSANLDPHLDRRSLEHDLATLGVVGRSAELQRVFRWAQKAGPLSSLPVLITGETGTGKELVARAIHHLDPVRRTRPFVPVNCGAINAGVAESELFGHRRGAFTGAERDRKGLIRSASGGILFLDEIGDLDIAVQGKLLRVLQERRVLALGEDADVAVDVRVVAATNRDLEQMVLAGTFRADLFHRLNVLAVRVPPLRERTDDIEPLVRHFLAAYARTTGRAVSVSSEFLEAVTHVRLPGNVRELENLVLRAYLAGRDDGQIRLNALPPEIWHQLAAPADAGADDRHHTAPAAPSEVQPPPWPALDPVSVLELHNWNFERSIDFYEHQIVAAALGASSGNRQRAAKLLGISPRGLFNKTRKHRVA